MVGKLTAIEYVDQVQDKSHTQTQGRHVQKSTGHTRTRGPRKYHTRSQARSICQDEQAGKRTNEGKVRADMRKVCAHRKGTGRFAVALPWQKWPPEKCDPRQWWKMALTSALLRAAKSASERSRGSEGRLCTRMQCSWPARRAPVLRGIANSSLSFCRSRKNLNVLFACCEADVGKYIKSGGRSIENYERMGAGGEAVGNGVDPVEGSSWPMPSTGTGKKESGCVDFGKVGNKSEG